MVPPIAPPDACCEAFAARYARLIVTAADPHWLGAATAAVSGYGTSVIGCDAEIGVERLLPAGETPDGRPGAAILAFHFGAAKLARAVANRVGQGLLTCPTAALFDGLPEEPDRAPLGDYLRYFGDGHEHRTNEGWAVPVMEGEVSLPATVGVGRGVAGGALLLCGASLQDALAAARCAADAVHAMPGVIAPFPGGVCRSGSKVGSRYRGLVASTNEAFCPTLADSESSRAPAGTGCVYEVVVNGVSERAVREAMRSAIRAACSGPLLALSACDYGGRLGRIRIPLRDLVEPIDE